MFIRAKDNAGAGTPANYSDAAYAPDYRWWRWEIGAPSATPIASQAPSSPGGLVYKIDGVTYGLNSSADYTTTTLTELVPEGALRDGLTLRGYPSGVVRVR